MPGDWTPVILLSIGSQLIGQGLLVYAMGHLSPVVVGLCFLTQPIAVGRDRLGRLWRATVDSPTARRAAGLRRSGADPAARAEGLQPIDAQAH